ncbi:hypothetical protein GMD78_07200 [Ornithinibacillus sp. L9]|uniref:Uncharacterized protein n=1 Tax=Ornithinibacillus caprae TaxID=2678566 RepID=A0A6N8FF48_9BACI|nr:hypothetical protein [Ornithinibacillus caprae]MUK88180.1 hypothetical protein [Ornithinibacillus caprae]
MAKDIEKKGIGWFKNSRSQAAVEQEDMIEQTITAYAEKEEQNSKVEEQEDEQTPSKDVFSKENQDKVSLDLIVSLENMLKDRQLTQYKNNDLEDQLHTANETINRLKQEHLKKDQLIQEKNHEINALETNLTNKQMSYDQLLEDYNEYQNTSNNEYEKISDQLETETSKYNKLHEESKNAQYQSMLKINELEERIRELEIENQKYADQHQQILDEKAQLMQTINDFTERMSISFSPKASASNSSES